MDGPGSVVHVDNASGALRRVEAASGAREVVIGVEVAEPLLLARVLHRARPLLWVTLLLRDEELGRLDRALEASPLALGPLRALREFDDRERAAPPRPAKPIEAWALAEGAVDAMFLVRQDGFVLGANPSASQFLHLSERALLGSGLPGRIVEAERSRLQSLLQGSGSARFTGRGAQTLDVSAWRIPGADSQLRVVLVRETPPTDAEAYDRGRFLDAIVENLPNMVFVKEARELRFVRFNKASEDLLGYHRSEMLGKNDADLFPAEEAEFFTRKDREVLAGRTVVDIAEEPIRTERGRRWLHTRKVPILDSSGQPAFLLGISEDITGRKAVEADRDALILQLERSNADLQQFASVASHDLQEPLRKVRMFGDHLRRQLGEELPVGAADILARMEAAVGRMQSLIDALFAYSLVASAAAPMEPVSLDEVMEEVVADLELRILSGGALVEVDALPTVLGDKAQLRQLFQNLVGNALKFHAPGAAAHVQVTGWRLPDEDGEGRFVEVVVRDRGIGFDAEQVRTIFEPFRRLDGVGRYEGTGMGLAICRRIVDRHGGTIRASSAPGQGASFVLRLPG